MTAFAAAAVCWLLAAFAAGAICWLLAAFAAGCHLLGSFAAVH